MILSLYILCPLSANTTHRSVLIFHNNWCVIWLWLICGSQNRKVLGLAIKLNYQNQNQNQNQNCYWWHVQMTIIHQDLWWGKLVPSPYKRSELSNRVFCSFSSRKESICKWIPISNSLGKEAALVNVSISKGGLKCQRVVISDMPNWGDKVIRRYTGCTLQTFVKHYDSTISPPFFQRFPL